MVIYNENEIAKAKKVAADNAKNYPKAPEGFWYNNIYIVSPFLDTTGTKNMEYAEAIAYYGEKNIIHFMSIAINKPLEESIY